MTVCKELQHRASARGKHGLQTAEKLAHALLRVVTGLGGVAQPLHRRDAHAPIKETAAKGKAVAHVVANDLRAVARLAEHIHGDVRATPRVAGALERPCRVARATASVKEHGTLAEHKISQPSNCRLQH